MLRSASCAGLLLLALLAGTSASAQFLDWDVVESITALAADDSEHHHSGRYAVELNTEPLKRGSVTPGQLVHLALPDGAVEFEVVRVQEFVAGQISVSARAVDGSFDAVALTVSDNGIAGLVHVGNTAYHLERGETGAILTRVEAWDHDEQECELHSVVDTSMFLEQPPSHAAAAHFQPHSGTMARSALDHVTLDLLIAYTAAARNWATNSHGSIETVIAQMMNLSQQALDNSEVHLTVRVVYTYEVDYNEAISPIPGVSAGGSHLRRLTAGPHFNPWGEPAAGFMEEIHDLRDFYGADLVALLASEPGTGGIAWLLSSIAGSPHYGFSVNRVQQMTTGYTLIHEIGHNLGSHHSRNQNSSAAGLRGGIFPYSTGWRWNGTDGLSYASVMTYAEGSTRIAHFSNPDILFQGAASGSTTIPLGPADNARSMRETKWIVANYRPTTVDPPVVAVTPASLTVDVESGVSVTRTLQIANSGASDLMWQVEVLGPAPAARPADLPLLTLYSVTDEALAVELPNAPENLAPGDAREGDVIYSTIFEAGEGFPTGSHIHRGGWTARSDAAPFTISASNPSSGAQHLRVGPPPSGTGATWVHSPNMGALPGGGYELAMDVSISENGGPSYFITGRDGRNGRITAGLRLSSSSSGNGSVAVVGSLNSAGSAIYFPAGTFEFGTYNQFVIRTVPETSEIEYLMNGEIIGTRPFPGGSTIGLLEITRNGGAIGHMDIDNVEHRVLYQGLRWLDASVYSGVVGQGQSIPLTLTLDASGLEDGTYEARVVVQSNDPNAAETVVPVMFNVGSGVSTGGGPGAVSTQLLGSYPNPVRDQAAIRYELASSEQVVIEVFTVTGQRVAMLVDELKTAGLHEATLDASGLASGVYIYRMRAGDFTDSGRLIVMP